MHQIHNDSTPVQNTEIFEGNFFNEEDRELVENCDKVQRRWEEEEIKNLKIINERTREELGKKEEDDDTDLDGPEDEFMQIVNEIM